MLPCSKTPPPQTDTYIDMDTDIDIDRVGM
jgi:hypothetical protein